MEKVSIARSFTIEEWCESEQRTSSDAVGVVLWVWLTSLQGGSQGSAFRGQKPFFFKYNNRSKKQEIRRTERNKTTK